MVTHTTCIGESDSMIYIYIYILHPSCVRVITAPVITPPLPAYDQHLIGLQLRGVTVDITPPKKIPRIFPTKYKSLGFILCHTFVLIMWMDLLFTVLRYVELNVVCTEVDTPCTPDKKRRMTGCVDKWQHVAATISPRIHDTSEFEQPTTLYYSIHALLVPRVCLALQCPSLFSPLFHIASHVHYSSLNWFVYILCVNTCSSTKTQQRI